VEDPLTTATQRDAFQHEQHHRMITPTEGLRPLWDANPSLGRKTAPDR